MKKGEEWQEKFVQENDLTKVSLNNVAVAQKAAKDAAIAHNASLDQMTIGAKAASLAMEALATVGNMIVSMAVTWVVSKVIEGIAYFVNYAENAKKAAEEASSKIKELNDQIKDTNTFVSENIDKYAEYAKGVSISGENASLSAEQFEEYHEITNKIAQTFPTMVAGYDAEGNAILKNKGNVEELTNALKEYNKEKAKEAFNNSEDVIEGEKAEIHGDLFHSGNKGKYEKINGALNILAGNDNVSDLYLKSFSSDVAEDLGLRKKKFFESINSYKEYLQENIDVIQNGAKEYSDKLENSNKKMATSLRNYLQVLSFDDTDLAKKYQKTGEGIKSLISGFIDTEDWDSNVFNGFTPVDYRNYIRDNIIVPITNLQPDVQKAINDFFSKTEATQEDVDALVNKISGTLQTSIKSGAIPENVSQFILNSIKNSVTTDGSNTSIADSINLNVDTLTKKIDEIQNAYKTLRDVIKEYNKEGYISVDTFQSIIGLGAEYLKYLVDENGNLRLDEQSLKNVTLARINDMVVAQKNSILDTAEKWTNEADALKYLRAGLDETSKSYDEIIEKRIQLLRTKWTEQTDENGNRVCTDEEIENTIAGLRKQFSSLDTLGNSAINGINNGLGMTSESAKDVAKNIKDINKQLDDLAKSEVKYKFDVIRC